MLKTHAKKCVPTPSRVIWASRKTPCARHATRNASGPSAKASSQARRFKKNESRPSANRQRYLAGDNWEGNSPEDKCKEMKVDRLLNDPARASSIKHKSNHRQLLAKPLIFFSPTNTWKDADPKSTSVQTSISNVQRETFMV